VVANRLTEEDLKRCCYLKATGYQTRDSNPSRLPKTTRLRGGLGLFLGTRTLPQRSQDLLFLGKVLGAPVRLMACSMFEVILTIMTTGRVKRLELSGCLAISRNLSTPHAVPTYHRVDGELSVTDLIAPTAISQRFIDAAMALGYDYNPDFRDAAVRVGPYQFTIRMASDTVLLLPSLCPFKGVPI